MLCRARLACVVRPIVVVRGYTISGIDLQRAHLCTGIDPTKIRSANYRELSASVHRLQEQDGFLRLCGDFRFLPTNAGEPLVSD